jgi:hypothetical protein
MCGTWKIDPSRRVFRDPGGFFAGYADTIAFCHGTVYVPQGTKWLRYARGVSGEVMLPMNTPATPACTGAAPPPSPPAGIRPAGAKLVGLRQNPPHN